MKNFIFIFCLIMIGCSKEESTSKNIDDNHPLVYAVSEIDVLKNIQDDSRNTVDTIYMYYPNLLVLSSEKATHQMQFEGVVESSAVKVKNYYKLVDNKGVSFNYDAFLITIKLKSGRVYKKHVIGILNNKGVELTEIFQISDSIIRSSCNSQMWFKTRKQFTDETAITYDLCRSSNHFSGRGSRFLFINR